MFGWKLKVPQCHLVPNKEVISAAVVAGHPHVMDVVRNSDKRGMEARMCRHMVLIPTSHGVFELNADSVRGQGEAPWAGRRCPEPWLEDYSSQNGQQKDIYHVPCTY